MRCAHKQNHVGFTLVEISIVMIIIGLLIGGTFGGIKLIENMEINKTVQDLKAIESAAITFKDTYGRLPGDMPNTAARLPNCTDAPCATGGNGNRTIGTTAGWTAVITDTSENFTFWHHLQAADILSIGTKNTLDMEFGEGQPNSPIGGGYRITDATGIAPQYGGTGCTMYQKTALFITSHPSISAMNGPSATSCRFISAIDSKIDDGSSSSGPVQAFVCHSTGQVCPAVYEINRQGHMTYDLRGF